MPKPDPHQSTQGTQSVQQLPGAAKRIPSAIRRGGGGVGNLQGVRGDFKRAFKKAIPRTDRKSTRLNSSHVAISYAVFCLKKKNAPGPLVHRSPPRGRAPRRDRLLRLAG